MSPRTPAVAGQFYEAGRQDCHRHIEALLPNPQSLDGLPDHIVGGVVPHAGWVFSGDLAAHVFAAIDARDEGADVVVVARTDARATDGLDEALRRARAFADMGADVLFVEAPRSEDEMRRFCAEVPGSKMANMVEEGDTPVLPPARLEEIGYAIAAYPLTLMLAGIAAMEKALAALKDGDPPAGLADFAHLREVVGFPAYYAAEKRYADDR